MKGPALLQGEIVTKLQKYIDKIKKSFSPQQLGQFKQTWRKAPFRQTGFKSFQIWDLALFQGELIMK